MGIGEPGRHLSCQDSGLHRLRPGTRVLICQEGHWCDFTGPVASLAMVLKNRQNVLIVRDGRRVPAGRRPRRRNHSCESENECGEDYAFRGHLELLRFIAKWELSTETLHR